MNYLHTDGDWIVAATAHPAKFAEVVEPIVEQEIPVPPALAKLLERPSTAAPIDATLEALREALRAEMLP